MFEHLQVESRDGIATVTIQRPKALNALNASVITELEGVFEQIAGDDAVRVVILTGAGDKAFVAGADIAEMRDMDPGAARFMAARGQALFSAIENLGKPVIAAINGYALGGGCELALACTIRIAADTARIGLPEVTLGLIPGYGGTQRLPRLVGRGRALEMILTGRPVDGTRAAEIGLANDVVPAAELMPTCDKIARSILSVGPVAVRHALDAVHQGLDLPLSEGLAHEAKMFSALFETDDTREGVTAFLEKRKPEFRGR